MHFPMKKLKQLTIFTTLKKALTFSTMILKTHENKLSL